MNPVNTPGQFLFLCTGNYYRSRFAELLFNHLCAQRGLPWQADSRALNIKLGNQVNVGPISRYTCAALERLGVHLPAEHRIPTACLRCDLESAACIIALKEAEHRPLLRLQFPDWEDRVEYWHVHDLDCAGPDEALAEVERLVRQLVDELADGRAGAPAL